MIPSDKLRALLADHPPQAYMSKDQEKIRDVWDAAREMQNGKRVWFAEADSLGGAYYFATESEWLAFVTTGKAASIIRNFLYTGYVDVTPENLVAALNGERAGEVEVKAPPITSGTRPPT